MKTTHTLSDSPRGTFAKPGDWTPQREIDGGNGIHVFYREPHFGASCWTRIDGPDLLAVALVLGLTESEVRQRARLVAAAPDLLAALQSVLPLLDVAREVIRSNGFAHLLADGEPPRVTAARAAIARATGGSAA